MPESLPEVRCDIARGGTGAWLVYRCDDPDSTVVARFFENPGAPIDAEACARMVAEELNKRVLKRRMG